MQKAFVEALDTCFEDVNELDILFHLDKVGIDVGTASRVSHGHDSWYERPRCV